MRYYVWGGLGAIEWADDLECEDSYASALAELKKKHDGDWTLWESDKGRVRLRAVVVRRGGSRVLMEIDLDKEKA